MHFSTVQSFSPTLRRLFQLDNLQRKVAFHQFCLVHIDFSQQQILMAKSSQFEASCKDSKKHQESWIYKTAKSFQGLAMYSHEVLMSLQTRTKFFGTYSLRCQESDIDQWRKTVYSMGKRWQHCHATSLMSDLDEVNFPVTVANCYQFDVRIGRG
jgi:hypothetical protein